jgi:glycerol kinase
MESMVFQAQDVLDAMGNGVPLRELRVDGGAAANDTLMQMQADLGGTRVSRPQSVESTALGTAYLAGLATGLWRDEAEVQALRREERVFTPGPGVASMQAAYGRWKVAISGLLATGLPPR